MDNLFSVGIQIIQWLQSLGAWLTPIMQFFTFLGGVQFYLLVGPAILWCIDANLGFRLTIFLMIDETLVSALKMAFHGPRPYWLSRDVKVLAAAENNFGAPSGHAQNAVIVWGGLAERIKKPAAWVIAVILVFFIGISRIYLAVHFPHDVLLGWVFGMIILWVLLKLENPVVSWFKKFRLGMQFLLGFLLSLLLILLVILAQLATAGWSLPPEWVNNAHLAFPTAPEINPFSGHNFLTTPGVLFGLISGWLWISRLGGFTTRDPWPKLVLRYIAGLLGVLILYVGLGALFPEAETIASYAWRYIRYALLGFWVSGFAPWIFVKLRLASRLRTN